jgi:hypothetical protein
VEDAQEAQRVSAWWTPAGTLVDERERLLQEMPLLARIARQAPHETMWCIDLSLTYSLFI